VHEGKGIESKLRATRQGIICMSFKRKELEESGFAGE
jgi:hypothetical protein